MVKLATSVMLIIQLVLMSQISVGLPVGCKKCQHVKTGLATRAIGVCETICCAFTGFTGACLCVDCGCSVAGAAKDCYNDLNDPASGDRWQASDRCAACQRNRHMRIGADSPETQPLLPVNGAQATDQETQLRMNNIQAIDHAYRGTRHQGYQQHPAMGVTPLITVTRPRAGSASHQGPQEEYELKEMNENPQHHRRDLTPGRTPRLL